MFLVVGASGATGRLLVEQLLGRGEKVRAIVRSPEKLPAPVRNHPDLSLVEASLLDLSDAEMARHLDGCSAVASCLGHGTTLRGIFGPPRRLVTDAVRRLCEASRVAGSEKPIRFVLMNTTGNRNRDLREPVSFAERCVVGLVRMLVPPHADNERAADYLRTEIGHDDPSIEWVVVRPDSLIDSDQVTAYEVNPSPTRSAIFNAGKTSRINVAHFMADLATEHEAWETWKGRMPVVYDEV